MTNEIYCYEPFASHNSRDQTYLAAVVKTWRNNFEVHWVLHDIKFKNNVFSLEEEKPYKRISFSETDMCVNTCSSSPTWTSKL